MTIRVPLPGDNWADLKGPDDLTGADIDEYEEFLDVLRDEALGPQPAPEPDPANPAVMKVPERPGKFSAVHVHRIRDKLLEMTVTGWSYEHLPLPYTAESRAGMSGRVCRLLEKAAEPAGAVLNNTMEEIEPDPKPGSGSTGTGGFSGTSPANTGSLPLESLPGPSATASG